MTNAGTARYNIVNLNEKRFEEWRISNIPVIFIWVDSSNGDCYWRRVTKKTQRKNFTISKLAKISPATSIDLSLYSEDFSPYQSIFQINRLRSPLSLGKRKYAKQYFIENLLGKEFSHPSVGEIKISWAFWKHLTNKDRPQQYIWESLSLLPAVNDSIQLPWSFTGIRRLWNITRGKTTSEGRLLIFDSYGEEAECSSNQRLIRTVVRERLYYRKDWFNTPDPRNEIKRELFLESIFEKKE